MEQFKYNIQCDTLSQEQEFYQEAYVLLEGAIIEVLSRLEIIRKYRTTKRCNDPVEHCKARIKSAESMKEKLERKGLQPTTLNALTQIYDAAGIRIVCTFLNDIYWIADMLKNQEDFRVIEEKDYIRNPNPNGYRSYHLIIEVPLHLEDRVQKVYCELQIRTIAMDCWASLEHQMKYKKDIAYTEMITTELKRCADEIASTDLNFQTILDMIKETEITDSEVKK